MRMDIWQAPQPIPLSRQISAPVVDRRSILSVLRVRQALRSAPLRNTVPWLDMTTLLRRTVADPAARTEGLRLAVREKLRGRAAPGAPGDRSHDIWLLDARGVSARSPMWISLWPMSRLTSQFISSSLSCRSGWGEGRCALALFIPKDGVRFVREFKGFRHVVRHAYDLDFRGQRLIELTSLAGRLAAELPAWCAEFAEQIRAEQGWA
jgi:hypothetical protein